MSQVPKLSRLDQRIYRSKRSGRMVFLGVLLVSMAFGAVLVHGLRLAIEAGRSDLVTRASMGLGLLVGLNLFSLVMIRRQHRMLNEAREGLKTLVKGELAG